MDPWNWSVEDVVHQLFETAQPWALASFTAKPPVQLAQTFRDEEINGMTLMCDLNQAVLREAPFPAATFGQRSAVIRAIEVLRNISQGYAAHYALVGQTGEEISTPARTAGPSIRSSLVAPSPYRPSVAGWSPAPDTRTSSAMQSPTQPKAATHLNQRSALTTQATELDGLTDVAKLPAQTQPHTLALAQSETVAADKPQTAVYESSERVVKGQLGVPIQDRPETLDKSDARPPKRRRVELISVPNASTEDAEPEFLSAAQARQSYFGARGTNLERMFWGAAQVGDLLDTASDEDDDFDLQHIPVPAGKQRFIKSRIQHFLQRRFTNIDPAGHRATAPAYPERIVKNGSRRALTLIDRRGTVPVFKKADGLLLDSQDFDPSNTEWDFLLERAARPDADDRLETSTLASYSSSVRAEMEAERLEAERDKARFMSAEAIDAAIDAALEAFEMEWTERTLPKRLLRAHAIWDKGRGRNKGSFDAEIQKILHLETRLARFRDVMHRETWKDASQVTKQCRSMEATISDLKDARWRLDLWKLPSRPAKIQEPRPAPPPKALMQVEDDETEDDVESLHSDSFIASDDQSDAAFVDISDVQHLPAPRFERQSRESPSSTDSVVGTRIAPRRESVNPEAAAPPRSREQVEPQADQDEPASPMVVDLSSDDDDDADDDGEGGDSSAVNADSPITPAHTVLSEGKDELGDLYTKRLEDVSDEEIDRWEWSVLEQGHDSIRIIYKILHSMEPVVRDMLMTQMFGQCDMDQVRQFAEIYLQLWQRQGDECDVDTMARLYVCWVSGTHEHVESKTAPPDLLNHCLSSLDDEFSRYYRAVGLFRSRLPLEDDPDGDEVPLKGRRKLKESAKGKELREDAAARRLEEDLRKQKNMLSLQSSQQEVGDFKTAVNPGKKDDEEYIYIHPHISRHIKDHQIEGIRFMWRETTVSGKSAQGCLLAHTMGLGKTMQSITLFDTIVSAASSERLRGQLPEQLREPRFLVLCPPMLIENWKAEFEKWLPRGSPIRVITVDGLKPFERLPFWQHWQRTKYSLLIMGYSMFRDSIMDRKTKSNGSLYPPAMLKEMQEILLQTPSLVVADEAHKMKNSDASVTLATKNFHTTRRVALTGSPLANNLLEYYNMIDWVAPDFLGDRAEFKMRYQNPIEAGLDKDSSKYEQRLGMKKLRLLKNAIKDKISRADVDVLKGTLPSKTEFVLTVGLTDLQKEVYSDVIDDALGHSNTITTSLFDIIDYLKMICNHPNAFVEKVLSPRKRDPPLHGTDDEKEDGDERKVHLNIGLEHKCRIFAALPERYDLIFSKKMMVLQRILVMCKSIGDSVLVFSHSIRTLDYIERVLNYQMQDLRYQRIDGKVKVQHRQGMTQDFNSGSTDVLLVSTGSGSLGLNMPAANRVVLVDFGFNPANEEQAVGRAYRIGQTKQVYVYHLVTGGTYEEELHNMTIFKKQLASRTIDDKTPNRAGGKMKEVIFKPKDIHPLDSSARDTYMGKDLVIDHLLSDLSSSAPICAITTAETLHHDIDEKLTEEEEQEVLKMEAEEVLRRKDPKAYNEHMYRVRLEMQNSLFEEARRKNSNGPTASVAQGHPQISPMARANPAQLRYAPPSSAPAIQTPILPSQSASLPHATLNLPTGQTLSPQARSGPRPFGDEPALEAGPATNDTLSSQHPPAASQPMPSSVAHTNPRPPKMWLPTQNVTIASALGSVPAPRPNTQLMRAPLGTAPTVQNSPRQTGPPSSSDRISQALFGDSSLETPNQSMWRHALGPNCFSIPVIQSLWGWMPNLGPTHLNMAQRILKAEPQAARDWHLFRQMLITEQERVVMQLRATVPP